MLQSTLAGAPPCGDVTPVQHIAQSLDLYGEKARFVRPSCNGLRDVPKTDHDYMDAMCAIAKCSSPCVAELLSAHVGKRKSPKQPDARYAFGAAMEAYALHVQQDVVRGGAPQAVRESVPFVHKCLLRAERNILIGFAHDPLHTRYFAYFGVYPTAACWTLSNLSTRMAMATLHQPRLAPAVFAPHAPFNVAAPGAVSVASPAPEAVSAVSSAPAIQSVAPLAPLSALVPAQLSAVSPATSLAPTVPMSLAAAPATLQQAHNATDATLMPPPAPRPPLTKRPRVQDSSAAGIACGASEGCVYRISDGTACGIAPHAAPGIFGGPVTGTPGATEQDLGLDDGFLAFLDGALPC